MKQSYRKTILFTATLFTGLMCVQNAFASETVTIPFVGSKWHCTAYDDTHPRNHSWDGDGHDYNAARDDALDRCQRHSDRPRSCEVHRGDCHQ